MMQTQTQVPPALQMLMSMGAQPTAPGPMGQPIPTIASQKAEQESQGLQALMPGAAVQANRMAQAMQPVTQGQLQQAMQQQSPGISGLPAPNMQRMAEGGVVGYAEGGIPRTYGYAPDYEDARRLGIDLSPYDAPEVRKEKLERLQKMREFVASPERGVAIPTESSDANERALAQAFSPAAQERRMQDVPRVPGRAAAPPMAASPEGRALAENINTPPQFNIDPNNPQALNALRRAAMSAGGVERQALMNKIAELESAQASRAMPATGVAALAERPAYDVASIPAAGAPYLKAAEEDVAKLRAAEAKRAEFEKTLPDLNARGIAALEAAEQERQRLLGVQRGDDKFNRQIALLRGFQGDRNAYDRVVAGQQARDDLARQAQLSFEQARIKEMQAQQARQLNQYDRAIALEKEAAALMEKGRDNALKAQQMQQGVASAQFQGAVQMRGQDMTAQTAAADRAARDAIRNLPTYEQQIAERVMNDFMAKNPGTTISDAYDFFRSSGKPQDRSILTYAQAAKIVDERLSDPLTASSLMSEETNLAKKEGRPHRNRDQIREALIRREMQIAGGDGGAAPASALPPGVTVKRIGQ